MITPGGNQSAQTPSHRSLHKSRTHFIWRGDGPKLSGGLTPGMALSWRHEFGDGGPPLGQPWAVSEAPSQIEPPQPQTQRWNPAREAALEPGQRHNAETRPQEQHWNPGQTT
jgi:hypothetical protein